MRGLLMRMGLPVYWEAARHWIGIAVSCAMLLAAELVAELLR